MPSLRLRLLAGGQYGGFPRRRNRRPLRCPRGAVASAASPGLGCPPEQAADRARPRPPRGETGMKVGEAIAEIMKREGVEILTGYPVNHLIEFAAAKDIRPVMVRQERIGLHMADAISRVTSGRTIGAFCMQH